MNTLFKIGNIITPKRNKPDGREFYINHKYIVVDINNANQVWPYSLDHYGKDENKITPTSGWSKFWIEENFKLCKRIIKRIEII